jgi:SAM-dependent methyltransferase
MCTNGCLDFTRAQLGEGDVRGRDVLEVGARDYNGTVRSVIEPFEPARYVGVDMLAGPGVDVVAKAEALVDHFGADSFDVVISTELLEHARDWRQVVSNLKRVTRPGGVLVLTTRSKGFPFHGCPLDFWRFELEDFRAIFSDFTIETLEQDAPQTPGVFLRARKPQAFKEVELSDHRLYSIVTRRRTRDIGPAAVAAMSAASACWNAVKTRLPNKLIDPLRRRVWRTALDQPAPASEPYSSSS